MRRPGVEPGAKAWEASMLPIHHRRILRVHTCILGSKNTKKTKRKQKPEKKGEASRLLSFFTPTLS